MTILTKERNTPRRERDDIEEHPVKGGVTIYSGALVCLDAAGWAIPGRLGLGLISLGRAEHRVSTVADGDATVRTRRGVMRYANTPGDLIDRSAIGKQAYIVDDQTVARTDGGGARSAAGMIRDVDQLGVWVEF